MCPPKSSTHCEFTWKLGTSWLLHKCLLGVWCIKRAIQNERLGIIALLIKQAYGSLLLDCLWRCTLSFLVNRFRASSYNSSKNQLFNLFCITPKDWCCTHSRTIGICPTEIEGPIWILLVLLPLITDLIIWFSLMRANYISFFPLVKAFSFRAFSRVSKPRTCNTSMTSSTCHYWSIFLNSRCKWLFG
jgi:hypothetical protein